MDFHYNAFGQLVRRERNGVPDKTFLWDRGNLLAELDGTATQRVAEYVYLPGLDRPLAMITGGTGIQRVLFTVQDQIGNVIGVFDVNGTPVEKTSFAPGGQWTSWTTLTATTS